MWTLRYDTHTKTYVCNRNTFMDIENRLLASKEERIGGGMEEEIAVKRYKFEYMEWIDKSMKRCSKSLAIRKIQITTIVKSHHTLQ